MFFLLFFLDDRRIRIQEAQKHTDPDPQHWIFHTPSQICLCLYFFITKFYSFFSLTSSRHDLFLYTNLSALIQDRWSRNFEALTKRYEKLSTFLKSACRKSLLLGKHSKISSLPEISDQLSYLGKTFNLQHFLHKQQKVKSNPRSIGNGKSPHLLLQKFHRKIYLTIYLYVQNLSFVCLPT